MLSTFATVTSLAEARRRRELKLDGARKPRVLFVAEDVTLAHVGRMITLATSLDASRYDVTLACGERYAHHVRQAGLRHVSIWSMSPSYFAERLAKGRVVHTKKILKRCVDDDLALIEHERPDLVVGDFRVSLGISAEVAHVPYAAVVNAYWSPTSAVPFPLPEHPGLRIVGLRTAAALSIFVRPLTFMLYLRPFNALRRQYGLAPVASLFEMYTHADWTLYPDVPELAPVDRLLPGHSYLGALTWEPNTDLPAWWNELPTDKPIVYLSIGSSGAKNIWPAAIAGLGNQAVTVIAATAGVELEAELPPNFYVSPYLPGTQAAARADVIVCNGGSGTIYQALSHGKPLVGIPSNADQHLAMYQVVRRGAGLLLRSGKLTSFALRESVATLLGDMAFTRRANELREVVVAQHARQSFTAALSSIGHLSTARAARTRRAGE